jgi:hypothetical protein
MAGAAYSPPREGGGRGAAGVVAETETLLVSDHPVCGAKGGLRRNFLDAAATPPHEALLSKLDRSCP